MLVAMWNVLQRVCLTFPKQQILDSSKLKVFADDNFKFNEDSRKFSKRVENTVGKGEIAHYKQFTFSNSVFKRLILQTRENQGLFGKGLIQGQCRLWSNCNLILHRSTLFRTLWYTIPVQHKFWKHLERQLWKTDILATIIFYFIPIIFLSSQITSIQLYHFKICQLQINPLWKSLKLIKKERVNPFPNKPWFSCVCSTSLLKTLLEKVNYLFGVWSTSLWKTL